MHRTLPLLFALGCAPAPSQVPAMALDTESMATDELARVDVRGTATAIARIAATLDALPAEDHAEVAAALARLSATDPFTRAALQLPFALELAVREVPAEELDRLVQRDWQYLQQGLATHVAALESLGVDLAASGDGPVWIDVEGLRASPDPLAATQPLIDALVSLAQAQDARDRAAIDADSERVERLTGLVRPCPRSPFHVVPGQPWTLGLELAGWHDALRKIRPFVDDPALAARIDAMLALYDGLDAANQTYRP